MSQGLHIVKTGNREADNGRFAAPRQTGVQIAVLDVAECFADGVAAGGAGGNRGVVDTLKTGADGNGAGAHVGDHLRNVEHADPSGTLFQKLGELCVGGVETADAAAHDDADAVGVQIFKLGAAVLHCLQCGIHRILGEGVGAAKFFLIKAAQGIEIQNLGRHLHRQIGYVDVLDGTDPADTVFHIVPKGFLVVSDGADHTDTGNDYSIHLAAS